MSSDPGAWWWRFSANKPRGWRQRVGQWLCAIGQRLDGRWFIAVEINAIPQLDRNTEAAVLKAGLVHAQRLLDDECRAAAVERVLRARAPQLYRDHHG